MFTISQILSRAGSILKTGTPQEGDTITVLPNMLMEPLPYPSPFAANLLATYSDSFTAVMQSTITNQPAGATVAFMTLVPGLWKLQFIFDCEFNWVNVNPLAQDNRLVLTQELINNIEIYSAAARNARQVTLIENRVMLLDKNSVVRLIQNGNGVGQTSTLQVSIHANRYL